MAGGEAEFRMASEIQIARTYFINLAMRTDRLAHMQVQLEGCHWPVERIEAIRLDKSPQEMGYDVVPRLRGQCHFVGIWLSHRKALERALETEDAGAFILLEDDVKIQPEVWAPSLKLRANLRSDWEILLLSPRFREPREPGTPAAPNKWIKAPYGKEAVLLKSARRKYVCSGAHFCVFRNKDVVRKVLSRMDECEQLYDVDLFYITQFRTYGVHDDRVSTAHYGSDHNG